MYSEFDITQVVEEIAMKAKENQEEFIFETIRPYCENVLQIKINKEELKQILLKGTQKQQPCDAISREDAVNALRKALYNYEDKTEKQFKESKELNLEDWFQHRIFVQNMNDIDVQTILELPPVKPQPKKGRWIEKEYMDTGLSEIWCSNCKDSNFYNQTDNPFIPTNYCPNCGADMRGEKA